jgi:radical SAM protein with 4Fe4S-binding SPASM domain
MVYKLRNKYPATRFLTYFDILSDKPDYYHPMWLNDPCPARKNGFISHSGDVFPCDYLIYLGDAFKAGNVKNQTIREIWHNSEGLKRFRTIQRADKCKNCELLYKKCYGGCSSETMGKRLIVDDPLCFKNLL